MATLVDPRDVVLEVSVQYGTSSIRVEDLLKIERGQVIELDQVSTEEVRMFVDGRLVAMGEMDDVESVRVVRITRTLNPNIWVKRQSR